MKAFVHALVLVTLSFATIAFAGSVKQVGSFMLQEGDELFETLTTATSYVKFNNDSRMLTVHSTTTGELLFGIKVQGALRSVQSNGTLFAVETFIEGKHERSEQSRLTLYRMDKNKTVSKLKQWELEAYETPFFLLRNSNRILLNCMTKTYEGALRGVAGCIDEGIRVYDADQRQETFVKTNTDDNVFDSQISDSKFLLYRTTPEGYSESMALLDLTSLNVTSLGKIDIASAPMLIQGKLALQFVSLEREDADPYEIRTLDVNTGETRPLVTIKLPADRTGIDTLVFVPGSDLAMTKNLEYAVDLRTGKLIPTGREELEYGDELFVQPMPGANLKIDRLVQGKTTSCIHSVSADGQLSACIPTVAFPFFGHKQWVELVSGQLYWLMEVWAEDEKTKFVSFDGTVFLEGSYRQVSPDLFISDIEQGQGKIWQFNN